MPKTLRLILGDQLNYQHSWFEKVDKEVTYVMMEVQSETNYVRHHIQKVIAFFLAMRAFKEHMEEQGHQFIYIRLGDAQNAQDFQKNITNLMEEHHFEKFEHQAPDEYRLDEMFKKIRDELSVPSQVVDSEHFLSGRQDVAKFFKGKKTYLLESFYRDMRKRYDIMMDGDEPLTGQWNYDEENRKKYDQKTPIPERLNFQRDVSEICELLEKQKIETIGRVDPQNFVWPITREEALENLEVFVQKSLPNFGTFQDALEPDEPYLFHSLVSFTLNSKILSPLEVVQRAIQHWEENQDKITIAQIEGFVRQIIGWREFMRGVYWAKMPAYAEKNFFGFERKLPEFYWTGDTKMYCLQQAIHQSLDHAYAHHIQRLMVTGNFALLAGVDPKYVDEWYLGIYIDAIEWVEITNTRGMSQFADGGIVGTKPYISSANYIDKMSHYCSKCHYSKTKKVGDKACPFNSLYWNFYDQTEDKLGKNPRVAMMYSTWNRMKADKREEILKQAAYYLENIDEL